MSKPDRTAVRRVLVVDQDLDRGEDVELGCLARGIDVARAETLCEAVRALGAGNVSLIVLDVSSTRLTAAEHAEVFHAVAPGVPVVMTIGPDTPVGLVAGFERLGFYVVPRSLALDCLLDLAPADGVRGGVR